MTDSNKYSVLAAFLPSQTIEILGKLSDVERCALARVSNNGPADLDNLPAFMMRVVERCAYYAVNMTSRPPSVWRAYDRLRENADRSRPPSVWRAYDRLRENADRLANFMEFAPSEFIPQDTLEAFLSAYRYAIRLCGWTLAERDGDGCHEHLHMDDVELAAQITEVHKIFGKMWTHAAKRASRLSQRRRARDITSAE